MPQQPIAVLVQTALPLPEAVALPDEVTHVEIVVVGRTRIITPVGESWDRWFDEPCMSADFMAEREQP
ncbi:AbrB/MazE/SpoVT family DNA-binding domain-containing protein, partial [Aeromonas sp. ASNIH8]